MHSFLRLSAMIVYLSVAACTVNPVTGERELALISADQELNIGKQNYLPYQQQQGGRYIVDPDLGAYVSNVGQKLAKLSGRPGLPYEFVVLNNDVPNAWALPGGKIAINRGLLIELDDEAQLAAVLGHEIVHAAGKHSVQKMQQSMLIGLGVSVAGIAASSTDYGQALSVGAGLGAGLYTAKYGRDQELESDAYGMEYMVKAGYDPMAAVDLQKTFVRLSEKGGQQGGWLEGLLASHPPSQERVNRNLERAKKLGISGKRNRTEYQRAIAQIKKDQDAYDKQQAAIKAAGEKNFDSALSSIDQAIKKQPEEALFYTTRGQILLSQNKDSEAAKAFSKATSINPDYYMGHLGLGLLQKKQKRIDEAKYSLVASAKLLPTQTAVYHLGEIELSQGNKDAAVKYFQSAAQQGGDLGKKAEAQLQQLQPPAAQ